MNYQNLNKPELIRGLKYWKNEKNKFAVIALSYMADPDKDPERDGLEWYENERRGTPKSVWEKEYEIDFSTKSGKLVYGPEYCDFNPSHHLISSVKVTGELIMSLDFGQQNPTHALIGVYTKEGILYIIDEYVKPAIPSVSSREMFRKFSYLMGMEPDEIDKLTVDQKRDLANDTFSTLIIDPTTRAKNRTKQKEGEEIPYSIIEDFYDNGWEFDPGINDINAGITRIREYFQIKPNGKANLYIFSDKCPELCWEIQKYKYKELGEGQKRTQNEPEKPVKRDDHGPDSLRYMIMTRPNKPAEPKREMSKIEKDIIKMLRPKIMNNEWDQD